MIPRPEITMIAAVADRGVIGRAGGLAWSHPDDLARFRRLTLLTTLIMGRRTFDSLPGRLPGRNTIVVTRNPEWSRPGVTVASSIPEALVTADRHCLPIMVAGGGDIYQQMMPIATRLEITHVDGDLPGDTYFPAIDGLDWYADRWSTGGPGFQYVTYRRRPGRRPTIPWSN